MGRVVQGYPAFFVGASMSIPIVTSLEMTCESCPAQWEGKLTDGNHVYIRWRHNELRVGVGPTLWDAVDDSQLCTVQCDHWSAEMTTEEMIGYLANHLQFNLSASM